MLASVQVYESPVRRASDLEETLLAYEDSKSSLPLEGFGESEVSNVRIINAKRMRDYELDAMRDIDVTREDVVRQFEEDASREAMDAKAAYRGHKGGARPETERFEHFASIRRDKSDSDSEREIEDIRRRYHRADQIGELNAALAAHRERRQQQRKEQEKLDELQSQWFASRREGGLT